MYKNNPNYTLKLVDLVNMYDTNFNYENVYIEVKKFLDSEKKYFYTDDANEWNKFIEFFCDTFFDMELNFDTFLDFKIAFRKMLKKYQDRAVRFVIVKANELNPLNTYHREMDSNTNTNHQIDRNSNSVSENHSSSKNHSSSQNNSSSKDFNLHSDTPSNSVEIDNLFNTKSNYITDANNNQGTNNSTMIDDSTGDTNSNSNITDTANENGNNTSLYKEVSNGYEGNAIELLHKYLELTTNVMNMYMEWIESEHLFSSVLY
jgi:hypothetical protein